MKKVVLKLPLYIGMGVLTLSIFTAAYQLRNATSVTQTQSSAKEVISATPTLGPSVTPILIQIK